MSSSDGRKLSGQAGPGLPFPAWDLFPLDNYWRLGYFKHLFHPLRTLGYALSLATGRFKTKVEMTIYRKPILPLLTADEKWHEA